jgi:aerobic-type carbon monoxide dehydrogenase small subunit (CoxS/CutS family)
MHLSLNVNHRIYEIDVPQGITVLGALRDDLGLTGTRFGCGQGVCGACMVLADGVPIPSCTLGAQEAVGKQIVTIEGLARHGTLHPVQRAFLDEDAMQCGYCTSGMVLSAVALLARTPHATDDQIRDALAPHLCRCGVYGRVIRAVRKAAR